MNISDVSISKNYFIEQFNKLTKAYQFIATTIREYLNENVNNQKHELPEYWYHGTNKYFEKFTLNNIGKNWKQSELGIYFTQYVKPGIYGSTAKEYAEDLVVREGGKPYIYKCKIHTKNPLVLNSNGWYSSNTYIVKLHQCLSGLQTLQIELKPLLMIHCVITRFIHSSKIILKCVFFMKIFVFNAQLSYIRRVIQN